MATKADVEKESRERGFQSLLKRADCISWVTSRDKDRTSDCFLIVFTPNHEMVDYRGSRGHYGVQLVPVGLSAKERSSGLAIGCVYSLDELNESLERLRAANDYDTRHDVIVARVDDR